MKTKEMCQEYLNEFTEEQCESLLFFLEMAQGQKDKGDIMRFISLYHNVDSARPQAWSDQMREDMRANPMWYVWSYLENHVSGTPVHLLEELFKKLNKDLEIK